VQRQRTQRGCCACVLCGAFAHASSRPSSPRRQLNNYGFRKVHTDHYQFGVAGFQRGSPDLLKSLKRHDAQRASKKPHAHGGGGGAAAKPEAEDLLAGPSGAWRRGTRARGALCKLVASRADERRASLLPAPWACRAQRWLRLARTAACRARWSS
jgi:hypothetical protein